MSETEIPSTSDSTPPDSSASDQSLNDLKRQAEEFKKALDKRFGALPNDPSNTTDDDKKDNQ